VGDGGRSGITITNNGYVGIGTTNPGRPLEVNGNASVTGSLDVGLVSTYADYTLAGNSYGQRSITCPAGTYLITGGGGHRDFNSAQQDIVVNYSGPDPNNPTGAWLIRVDNNSSSDRAIRIYCNCARIR
jgi:hypothetical protein